MESFEEFWNNITDYFIQKNIIINDDDATLDKIEKVLIKYRRIIGLIFLIILLYIGYSCDFDFHKLSNDEEIEIKKNQKTQSKTHTRSKKNLILSQIQNGGAGGPGPGAGGPGGPGGPKKRPVLSAAASSHLDDLRAKDQAATAFAKEKQVAEQKAAKQKANREAGLAKQKEVHAKRVADAKIIATKQHYGKKLMGSTKIGRGLHKKLDYAADKSKVQLSQKMASIKSAPGKAGTFVKNKTMAGVSSIKNFGLQEGEKATWKGSAYNIGAAGIDKFKEWAPWLYGMIYAVAITIVVCLVVLPSLGFFIAGIICFFLLKKNMGKLKGL